jgi:hypothetical protein
MREVGIYTDIIIHILSRNGEVGIYTYIIILILFVTGKSAFIPTSSSPSCFVLGEVGVYTDIAILILSRDGGSRHLYRHHHPHPVS